MTKSPVVMACRWSSEVEILGCAPCSQGSLTRGLEVTVNRQILENSVPAPLVQKESQQVILKVSGG